MAKTILSCTVNGEPVEVLVQPYHTLLEALRDTLGLTGAKEGCGTGDCGACTVHVDGQPVCSCLMLALQARGRAVTTVEGLGERDTLAPLQDAFVRHGVPQCGFCIPGVIMSASALLAENPLPTEEEIRYGIAGNLCRCTGYTKMVAAIREASGQGAPVAVAAGTGTVGETDAPVDAISEPEATGQADRPTPERRD
jgi:aerobic carbon-monoxide dehydrogenase small subunit